MCFDRLLEAVAHSDRLMGDVCGWGGTFAHSRFVDPVPGHSTTAIVKRAQPVKEPAGE